LAILLQHFPALLSDMARSLLLTMATMANAGSSLPAVSIAHCYRARLRTETAQGSDIAL